MRKEWLEIQPIEEFESVTFEDFEPSSECPFKWDYFEDLDACIPDWTIA